MQTFYSSFFRRHVLVWAIGLLCLLAAVVPIAQAQKAGAPPNQSTEQRIWLPFAFRDDSVQRAPLALNQLGAKVPVALKQHTFFSDQINDSKGNLAIWVPPNANPVRGIFFENSGANLKPNPADPDWRNEVAQNRVHASRQLASLWGFAYVTGTTWLDSCRNFTCQEALWNTALNEFIQATGRTELTHAPLMIVGASRTSGFGVEYAKKYPERTIAYAVSAMDSPGYAPTVPGIVVYGERDDQASRISTFLRDRGQGGLLSLAVLWGKGHVCDRCGDLIWPWMDEVIRLRLPNNADPRQGPVALKPLRESDGWLGDVDNWGNVYPYNDYPGDKRRAAWLPSRSTARIWQHFVQKTPAATISWPTQVYSWSNGFTQEVAPFFGRKARDLAASKPFDLAATVSTPPTGAVMVLVGDQIVGTATLSTDGKQLELKGIQLRPGVHSLMLMQGDQPLSWPAGLMLLP